MLNEQNRTQKFSKARQLLGTEAPKTLIFEDSFHGVSAAHSAGIPVIMVPDLLQPTEVIQENITCLGEFTSSATLFKIIKTTLLCVVY